MKTQKTILCATLVLLFVLAGPASAYWHVIDLGTLSGGNSSMAYSINNKVVPEIVGGAYDSSGWDNACLFDSTGGGANNLGSLGGPGSVAWSINNSGQIVGDAHIGAGYTARACLFKTGGNQNLGILTGYEQSGANSINNQGQIVGASNTYGHDFAAYSRACLFYQTGGSPTDLGALSSYAHYSWAYSINDNGQIVGMVYSAPNPSNPTPYHACLFDATGGGANIDLGTVIGFNATSASSINDHGQIVGDAWKLPYPPTYHACLFDPTGSGNNIDLNTLIDPSSGWTLQHASSINNNGWIVGYGINPDGYTRAYLLIPEPATMLLLGLGSLVLLRRRRGKTD